MRNKNLVLYRQASDGAARSVRTSDTAIDSTPTGLLFDAATAQGTNASLLSPWLEGAKVWLTAPDLENAINLVATNDQAAVISGQNTPQNSAQFVPKALRFTLTTVPERLQTGGATPAGVYAAAPIVYRPVFTSSAAGWSLAAHTDANADANAVTSSYAPESLTRQGARLYSQSGVNAGLP